MVCIYNGTKFRGFGDFLSTSVKSYFSVLLLGEGILIILFLGLALSGMRVKSSGKDLCL